MRAANDRVCAAVFAAIETSFLKFFCSLLNRFGIEKCIAGNAGVSRRQFSLCLGQVEEVRRGS